MTTTLTFLGAARTVTGTKFLVEPPDTSVLLDCGLFQGLATLRRRNSELLPTSMNGIDAIVLTYAHLDHTGYLHCWSATAGTGRYTRANPPFSLPRSTCATARTTCSKRRPHTPTRTAGAGITQLFRCITHTMSSGRCACCTPRRSAIRSQRPAVLS